MVKRNKSREYTQKEVEEQFTTYITSCIHYWENEKRVPDIRGKLKGLAHSILVGIDGESLNLPKFILAPDPHPDDKPDNTRQGRNYFPENHKSKVKCNISGELHESL